MRNKINIGARIQLLRKAKKISQQELADKIKTSPFYLSKIERGERVPSVTFCYNTANALKVPVYELFFERKTNIKLPDNTEVKDLRCPLCHKSLIITNQHCGLCNSKIACFLVGAASIKVPFYICTKSGCQWHAISSEDENQILLDNSDEW